MSSSRPVLFTFHTAWKRVLYALDTWGFTRVHGFRRGIWQGSQSRTSFASFFSHFAPRQAGKLSDTHAHTHLHSLTHSHTHTHSLSLSIYLSISLFLSLCLSLSLSRTHTHTHDRVMKTHTHTLTQTHHIRTYPYQS